MIWVMGRTILPVVGGTGDIEQSFPFGEYTILGRLGEGGMCHVFRARRAGHREELALKLLREEHRSDPRMVDHFVTEADVSLMLSHPNLIRTVDAGETEGRHYIAMELVEGASLKQLIAQCQLAGVPFPPDFSLYIISEVLAGLGAVHAATSHKGRPLGLVHRDVTPHNIFLGFDGRVALGDFGIAQIKAYGDVEIGGALGKIGYLSPEAAAGEEIDHRSDLFSIAIIVYELLTHNTLFEEKDDETTLGVIAEARVPRPRRVNASLSRDVEEVILRGLSKRPRDRFQDAEELRLALEPAWSPFIGNRHGLAAFMTALFRITAPDRQPSRRGSPLR
jgi:serine/threonine-protein kinase